MLICPVATERDRQAWVRNEVSELITVARFRDLPEAELAARQLIGREGRPFFSRITI